MPLDEGNPLAVRCGASVVKLPTDLTRGPPCNRDRVPSTLEPCPSREKQTPVQTLMGDQHTKKGTNEHPIEGIETEEESNATNLIPAPSHMNNREKH